MKFPAETEIYKLISAPNVPVESMIRSIVSGNARYLTHLDILPDLNTMKKIYKADSTVPKIINRVSTGDLRIFYSNPAEGHPVLPDCIPFFKYKDAKGKLKVAINVTNELEITRDDENNNEIGYGISPRVLYCKLLPAYAYLTKFDKSYTLGAIGLEEAARIWAKMYSKVLNTIFTSDYNQGRSQAFMYFAAKFFLKYIMECPDVVSENIATSIINESKTQFIMNMEKSIAEQKLEPYRSITDFCKTMFSKSVSNVQGVRTLNIQQQLNTTTFIKKYIMLYDYSALLSLVSFPYFLFTIMASYNTTNMVNHKALNNTVITEISYGKLLRSVLSGL